MKSIAKSNAIPDSDSHRRPVLRALLLMSVAASLLFAVINVQRGVWPLVAMEVLVAAYCLWLFQLAANPLRVQTLTLAYLVPVFCSIGYAFTRPDASATVFVWVMLFPILTHLLLGRWLGLLLSVVFVSITAVIFIWRFANDMQMLSAMNIANVAICTFCIMFFSHVFEVHRERFARKLHGLATCDPLTGLANRSQLKAVFEREKAHCERMGSTLSLCVIDLDHFKRINDDYGHDTGDQALSIVARLLQKRVRAVDLVCRVGGEEFMVLLPNTSAQQAKLVAEDLRTAVEKEVMRINDHEIRITLSIGIAQLTRDGHQLDMLCKVADSRLYASKRDGRNQVSWMDAAVAPGNA